MKINWELVGQGLLVVAVVAVIGTMMVFAIQSSRPITAEQAEQINVWRFEQPEIKETIEKYSKDGVITRMEYSHIENAYRAAIANEELPRVMR